VTIEEIFLAAVEKAATERAAYLESTCGDAGLRAQVEALLRAHEEAGSLLEQPLFLPGPTVDQSPPSEAPGAVIGPYKLVQVIGEGGMGTVYLAQQSQPVRRLVALKVIKAGMDTAQVIARFEAERQALAMMDHPNIAKVFDAGTTDQGRPYFVMELVKGVPITKYCDDHHLTPKERLELFVPVCQAVQHAHQKGIIHRDLKPTNVLVAPYDGRPVPKVIDFGVAKAAGQPLTEKTLVTGLGAVVGTLEYMSPEQAELNNLDVDTRSDIYSLGVLLYELLTGSTPLSGGRLKRAALLEALRLVREEDPPKPSTRLSTTEGLPSIAANRGLEPKKLSGVVRGELDWIAMKALEKDRTRRYETANGLAMDIQRYLADEPVQACPPSSRYRLKKFVRRNKGPVLAASLVLLALFAGVAVSAWQAIRATAAEQIAKENEANARTAAEAEKRARQAEADERGRAEDSDADTKAFADFLAHHILAATRPEGLMGGVGVNVTMAEALAKAEPDLDEVFRGRPRAEALARHEIGETWRNLGRYPEALRHLRRALELRRQVLGPDADDTLNTMNSLGIAYREVGALDQAVLLHKEVLAKRKEKLGAEHADTLNSMDGLATTYQAGRDFGRALPLFEQALAKQKELLGPNHTDTLRTTNNLAATLLAAGQLARAVAILEEALARTKERFGPRHPYTLTSMGNLAGTFLETRQPARAIPLFEAVLAAEKEKLGPDHPSTLVSAHNLAGAYRADGQLARALPLYEETLAKRKEILGFDHPDTLSSMNALGSLYWSMRKLDQSVPLLEETLRLSVKKLGVEHPDCINRAFNLGVNYRDAGLLEEAIAVFDLWLPRSKTALLAHDGKRRFGLSAAIETYTRARQYDKAEPLLREQAEFWKQESGADSPPYAGQLAALGLNLLQQAKYVDAEPLFRECLAIRERKEPDDWRTFSTKSMLGGALVGQKKYADAEPLLVQGYEGMNKRESKIPAVGQARLIEALERLVQLYDARSKPDEAARWRAELAARKAPPKVEKKPSPQK
jgi:eukaryotic-like serine/threonine-protein kinase